MVIRWLSDGYPMVIRWLSDGYPMVIRWLSDGYPMVIHIFKYFDAFCKKVMVTNTHKLQRA